MGRKFPVAAYRNSNHGQAMSAYLFTGWTSQFNAGRLSDSCVSLVIYGGHAEHARARFKEWLLRASQGEDPVPTKIEKIVSTAVLEHLFTEQGPVPMDWPQVLEAAARASEAGSEDAFEQGCWADCNGLVDPGRLSPDLESLRGGLPEDVRSGLNWSAEKQHFQIVSVLSPPVPPPPEEDFNDPNPADLPAIQAEVEVGEGFHLNDRAAAFPELVSKETAVVVRARNSLVAAWLWRRAAATTRLARNSIRVDPWCGAEGLPEES
jgi:hypothetical protein